MIGSDRQKIDMVDFVVFLSEDWDVFFRRYLLRAIARESPESRILCVDRPVCLTTTPLRAPYQWVRQMRGENRLRQLEENLFVYRPWIYLHDHIAAKLPAIQALNMRWVKRQLEELIQRLGLRVDRLATWIYDPFQAEYLGILNQQLSIYECFDDYVAWRGVPFFRTPRDLEARENLILQRVDLTFVVSEVLYESRRMLCKRVHLIPNGVDAQHFELAHDEHTEVAADMIDIRRPVIGYVGNLNERIELTLLVKLAQLHSDWSLVLVGGMSTPLWNPSSKRALAMLEKLPNVHLLGAKPYEELPRYMKAFDVCLLPYVTEHPFNLASSPLKLYEYLATGKPIVSTDLPAVRSFDGLVYIAHNNEDFERQVLAALGERNADLSRRRIEAARENSWDQRAREMLTIIQRALLERASGTTS